MMNKYAVISVTMAVVGTNCNSFQTASFTNIRNIKSNERQTRTNVLSMNQLSPEFSTNGPFSEHVNMFNNPFAIADSSTLPSGEPLPAVEGLSPEANIIVFIIGIIPFIWATYEFWSRIAVGASFGTGETRHLGSSNSFAFINNIDVWPRECYIKSINGETQEYYKLNLTHARSLNSISHLSKIKVLIVSKSAQVALR